ncbi:endonuclease SmrB [Buchnera aphidicola]|uniref:endonuclease SmrB n=1 Tax=Buchnera aphidicola TaxID=9 RepID=UPI003463EB71
MKKKELLDLKDHKIFKNYLNGTKKIFQDKVFHFKQSCKKNRYLKKYIFSVDSHIFYFSDYQDNKRLFNNSPLYYIRKNSDLSKFKKLKSGYYDPKIFLDLHGFTRLQAKIELGHLMQFCKFKKIDCINIIYGQGKNILKNQVPIWLSKHPNVVAFHKSPKSLGNTGAVLVLTDF